MPKTADPPKGKIFIDARDMTLHAFDKDAGGKSMCSGPCAASAASDTLRRPAGQIVRFARSNIRSDDEHVIGLHHQISARCIEWGEDTETKEKPHSNLAVRRAITRTSHETILFSATLPVTC
jgi:hypothetical protein